MSQKRRRSPSPALTGPIYRSIPILDRSSKFVALYSPSLSAKELQAQPDIKSATHRVAAWRKPSNQRVSGSQCLFDTSHDDDGERYGGKTLDTVLASMQAEGAVVVARWYGGVMLGPARFDHIRDCAREAVLGWMQENESASKRLRIQEDIRKRDQLARILQERDQSITVLRTLLAEKTKPKSLDPARPNTAGKVPQYSNFPLSTLEKLEQVRDATIGWILRQIEKAEDAQQDGPDVDDTATAPQDLVLPKSFQRDNVPVSEAFGSAAFEMDEELQGLSRSPRSIQGSTTDL